MRRARAAARCCLPLLAAHCAHGADPTANPSRSPSRSPQPPSNSPTTSPGKPSTSPSRGPTAPSKSPSAAPTRGPDSTSPPLHPSAIPSRTPSGSPSLVPTGSPSGTPTGHPSFAPTETPIVDPNRLLPAESIMFILLDAVDKQRTLPGLAGSYTIIAATAQQKGDTPDVHCEVTIMGVFDQYRLQPQYVTKTKVSIASLMQVNSSRINNMTLWSGSIIAAFDLLNSPPPTPVPTEAKDRLLPIFVMPVVISVTSLCAAVAVTVLACHFQKQRSQQHVENKKLRNLKEDQKQREEEQEMQQRWGQSQRGSMRGASIRAASEADSPAAQHLRERQGTDASEPYATGETPHQMRGDDPDRYASGGAPAYPSGAPTMPMAQSITSPADVMPDSPTGHGGSMAVESQSRSTRIQVGQTPRDFGDSTHA